MLGPLLLAAGAIALLSRGNNISNTVDKFRYNVTNFSFGKLSLSDFQIKFDLVIENPTKENVKFDSFYGKVLYNGKEKGTFNTRDKINIQPSTTTKLKIITNVKYSAAAEFLTLFIDKKVSGLFLVDGILTINQLNVPVKKEFKLS